MTRNAVVSFLEKLLRSFTHINIAEDSKKASHALKPRDHSWIKAILKLREGYKERNADDTLLFPQSDKYVPLLIIHLIDGEMC